MPRHKKGTLVRVLTEELIGDEDEVEAHGLLWLVISHSRRSNLYECKSVVTGNVWCWYPHEITTKKEHNDD